jgi:hypothetical protein
MIVAGGRSWRKMLDDSPVRRCGVAVRVSGVYVAVGWGEPVTVISSRRAIVAVDFICICAGMHTSVFTRVRAIT